MIDRMTLLLVAALCACATGCVSSERYAALETQYISERDNKKRLLDETARLREELTVAFGHRGDLEKAMKDLEDRLKAAERAGQISRDELAKAQADLAEAMNRYLALQNQHKGLSSQLDRVMDELGRQEGIEYLRSQGKLALSESLLFSPGEALISEAGKTALVTLADALNAGTELVRVEGHTDSDPVSRTSTVWRNGNWELAGARALSVLVILEKAGVHGSRMHFVGRGPYMPIASNDSREGKARNRRVEIYVMAAPPTTPAPPAGAADR